MPIPEEEVEAEDDMTEFVSFKGDRWSCNRCGEVIVRIEPGGIFGGRLTALDKIVIRDHHLALHS